MCTHEPTGIPLIVFSIFSQSVFRPTPPLNPFDDGIRDSRKTHKIPSAPKLKTS